VTFNLNLSGQFLRAVAKMRAVGRKNDTDRTQKLIFACGWLGGYSTLE
jgi:fluoride ion exporter CrcB/FEX